MHPSHPLCQLNIMRSSIRTYEAHRCLFDSAWPPSPTVIQLNTSTYIIVQALHVRPMAVFRRTNKLPAFTVNRKYYILYFSHFIVWRMNLRRLIYDHKSGQNYFISILWKKSKLLQKCIFILLININVYLWLLTPVYDCSHSNIFSGYSSSFCQVVEFWRCSC